MSHKGKNVKSYRYSEAALDEITAMLSPERFATYLKATNNDREQAARLYVWNTAISAAFYGPLQAVEVALRNAMHTQLSATYGIDWYDRLNKTEKQKVEDARNLAQKSIATQSSDIIANLSLGFWVSLLYRRHERLWREALYKAFPHTSSLNRKKALKLLMRIRNLRNRIAHHEPIFTHDLRQEYQDILTVMGWLCPHKQAWVEAHSRVPNILTAREDNHDLRF